MNESFLLRRPRCYLLLPAPVTGEVVVTSGLSATFAWFPHTRTMRHPTNGCGPFSAHPLQIMAARDQKFVDAPILPPCVIAVD